MFTHNFQLILIFFSIIAIVFLGVYAVYCRRRAKSFVGTGRLTDIESWAIKSTIMWIATFMLAFVMAIQFILG
nr:hypothetical protein [Mucilaginibacter sp. L294]